MYLIVGLGNPEPDYSNTRHNMGFCAINKLSETYHIEVNKKKFDSLYGVGEIEENKVILLKPQTFMNDSGKAIIQAMNFYKIEPEKVIVIYDDIDLPVASVKIRKKGGPGNHNGMKSVEACLGTTSFPRIRIGTGKPEFKELLVQYVIGPMTDEQRSALTPAIDKAAKSAVDIIKVGIDRAMNLNN